MPVFAGVTGPVPQSDLRQRRLAQAGMDVVRAGNDSDRKPQKRAQKKRYRTIGNQGGQVGTKNRLLWDYEGLVDFAEGDALRHRKDSQNGQNESVNAFRGDRINVTGAVSSATSVCCPGFVFDLSS